ncbi:MAG: DUF58 domain-containing protein [Planctomycetota bacterium]
MKLSTFETIFDFLIQSPIVMLFILSTPLWIIAGKFDRFPTKRLLYLLLVPIVVSLVGIQNPFGKDSISGSAFIDGLLFVLIALDIVVLLLAIVDSFLIVTKSSFVADRNVQHIASQGKRQEVEIELTNRSAQSCKISICDDLPNNVEAFPVKFDDIRLEGLSKTAFVYDWQSKKRGMVDLEWVYLKVSSFMGFWNAYYRIPCQSRIHVYPDLKQITEYDLLARKNRLNLMGMRRSRKIGQDNDFERLRDYTQDDHFKHIDWRSTARRQKLTVREFQANQSQRVIFVVDSGRMMTSDSDGVSLFDHAINSMLMLSYIALRQGDSVGLITFSNGIHSYTAPKPGAGHINKLLHVSCQQQVGFVESRFDEAFLHLRKHCPKRSLVVLMTNIIDEINSFEIQKYMGMLSKRHLPLAVFLRDYELFLPMDEFNGTTSPTDDLIFETAASVEILSWRQQLLADLRHQGILTLDVFPEKLTADLVNRYLEIKARQLL